MKTQINILDFKLKASSISIFSCADCSVQEIAVEPSQISRLRDFGQFYIDLPEDTQRLDLEIGDEFFTVEIDENTKRAIHVPSDYRSHKKELSVKEKEELKAAIEKSLKDSFAVDAYDNCQNEDEDEE